MRDGGSEGSTGILARGVFERSVLCDGLGIFDEAISVATAMIQIAVGMHQLQHNCVVACASTRDIYPDINAHTPAQLHKMNSSTRPELSL
mmetsp:Transcript_91556/g.144699  ORF Transcript_91556/g.144699 Transcript_91556/m.144699 type:complete len:90 (-) Transcript_91556:11-280(-)